MNEQIRQLIDQISSLEEDLVKAIKEQENAALLQFKGKKVEFEESVRQAHLKLKKGIFKWLVTNRPQNLITSPIIYSMIVPIAFMDLCVSFYQFACFPIYGIAKVKRKDYFIYDRQQLEYLNFIEKFHCTYCAYGNGLVAYITEIIGRTEAYFCPIKHARKRLSMHSRYSQFLSFGDAADYEAKLEKFRVGLK